PHDFSMMTLRPRGPRVTLTVLARMLSPLAMLLRALVEKTISLAAMTVCSVLSVRVQLLNDRENVVLAQNQVLGAVDLDVAARVLREEDLVARLDLELADRSVLLDLALAHGDGPGLERLLLRRVLDVEARRGLLLLVEALHQDAVVKWLDLHRSVSLSTVSG